MGLSVNRSHFTLPARGRETTGTKSNVNHVIRKATSRHRPFGGPSGTNRENLVMIWLNFAEIY